VGACYRLLLGDDAAACYMRVTHRCMRARGGLWGTTVHACGAASCHIKVHTITTV
jgi:hypothetical protein